MEETVTTTADVTVEQTTPDVTETTQPETNQTIEETVTKEPETTETKTTETESQEPKVKEVKNWEQIAKDNQASFTRVSQEKAELVKRIEDLESKTPKLVQEGKINPEFEQKYKFDVDNQEFLAYDNLARQLEPETRQTVENLLNEARRLYNPTNNRAYESKLAEIKDYFRSDLVEQIAIAKQAKLSEMKGKFNQAIQADKQEKANMIAQAIENVPELKELLYQESENYSPEVFGIVKTMFDYTGGVDLDATQKAISKIKDLGVKEYLAKQTAEKEKAQANVPTGETVVQKQSTGIPTRDEMIANPSIYEKAVKKFGAEKVDDVIMKG